MGPGGAKTSCPSWVRFGFPPRRRREHEERRSVSGLGGALLHSRAHQNTAENNIAASHSNAAVTSLLSETPDSQTVPSSGGPRPAEPASPHPVPQPQKDLSTLPVPEPWDLKKAFASCLSAGQACVPARELCLSVHGPGAWLPSGTGREHGDLFPPRTLLSLRFTLSLLPSYLT